MATSISTQTGQPDNYGLGRVTGNALDSRSSGSSTSTGSNNSVGSSNSTSTTSGSSSSSTSTNNMSNTSQAALDRLIQMLMKGGTPEMQQQTANRNAEISSVRSARSGYSKEAAFNDAQGLIAQQMRRALESMLPSINRAAEDAGSSGGALRALLLQDAAQRASESSSAAGLNAAVSYGGINANLSQVLESLTRGNPATDALIQALNVAKGAQTTSTTTGNSSQTTQQIGTHTQSGSTGSTTKTNESKDYAPFQTTPISTGPIYFGPADGGASANVPIGSTLDTLMQLAGDNAWSGYKI